MYDKQESRYRYVDVAITQEQHVSAAPINNNTRILSLRFTVSKSKTNNRLGMQFISLEKKAKQN